MRLTVVRKYGARHSFCSHTFCFIFEIVNTICVKIDMDIIPELMIFIMYFWKNNRGNDEKVTKLVK